jgi:hypothetical protein
MFFIFYDRHCVCPRGSTQQGVSGDSHFCLDQGKVRKMRKINREILSAMLARR